MEDIENAIQELEEVIKCSSDEQVQQLVTKFENRRRVSQMNGEHDVLSLGPLGNDLHDLKVEVVGLAHRGKSKVPSSSSERGALLRPKKLVGDITTRKIMKKTWDHLMDDETRKIGFYGAKGIGKTIIMKHINDCLIENRSGKFDRVIWVTVSETPKLTQLQNDIAFQLGLNLSNCNDVTTRADLLRRALRDTKRYVMILDDMCIKSRLRDIGIPEPTVANGCKLILTAQSVDTCKFMECDETIHMGLLLKAEAWELFRIHGKHDDNLHVQQTYDEAEILFLEYCLCLPLSFVKVSKKLAGKTLTREWRDAREDFKKEYRDPDKKIKEVIGQLKSAYPCMRTESVLYDCLLYCAIFLEMGENQINKIINVLIDAGKIEDMQSIRSQMDKGNGMLDILKTFGCLEKEQHEIGGMIVEMHDTIKFMVRQIIGQQYKGVREMYKWSEDLGNLLLVEHKLEILPPKASLKLPKKLSALMIHSTSLLSLSKTFFNNLDALKIIDLCHVQRLSACRN